jgi:hypothetical protein
VQKADAPVFVYVDEGLKDGIQQEEKIIQKGERSRD